MDDPRHVRRPRRRLLLGTGAAWAMAGVSLRAVLGETRGAGAAEGRQGLTGQGGIAATILREIDFDRPNRVANHMAWSAGGERLAIGGSLDLRMSVLDVQTGRQLPAPGEQLAGVQGLAYSPDGRYLAVIRAGTGRGVDPAAPRYTVSLWDAHTSALVRTLVEPEAGGIQNIQAHALTFSTDGRYLAVAYLKQLAVYAVKEDGQVERVLILPAAARCAFRPASSTLASLSFGLGKKTFTLHEVPRGGVVAQFDAQATNLGWSADGRTLAVTDGSRVAIYDPPRSPQVRTLTVSDREASFQSVSFSADGHWLAAAAGRRVDIWETATWVHQTTLGNRQRFVSSAGFSPRGTMLAVAGDAPITIWDVR